MGKAMATMGNLALAAVSFARVKAGQSYFLQRFLFSHRRWASRSPPSPPACQAAPITA
jgi:hypothetical protein